MKNGETSGGSSAERSSEGPLRAVHLGETSSGAAGAAAKARESALALARLGVSVAAVTPADGVTRACCDAAGIEWHGLRLRSVLDLASMRRLVRLTRARRAQVVHAHGPVSHCVALGALLMGATFRLVVTRSRTFPVRVAVRPALRTRRVARIAATCEAVRQVVVRTAGMAPERVEVAHPGVDVERFDPRRTRPGTVRLQLGIPAQARVVAHVGMHDWKGWREVLAAFPSIRAACPDAHLLLIGCRRPEQRAWVAGLAREMGLAESVSVALFRDDIADVLACAELLVDASWAGTGLARSLCEAMALGKPVVATACGGSPELVDDGRTGLLVPPRDNATLAAAVGRLLRDVEFARSLAAAGQAHVLARFTAEGRAHRLVAIYDAVIREPLRARARVVPSS